MREVTVACENPRAAAREERTRNVYHRTVAEKLGQAGYPKSAVDWDYVEAVRKTGVDPRTAAALALKKPHAHAVVGIASEGAEEDRSALGDDCGCEKEAPKATPADSGFSKVVKDPKKWEAILARAKAVGPLDTDAQLYRFIKSDLENQDQEIFYAVGLDAHNGLRMVAEVARGQRDRVAVDVADILRAVVIEGCRAFVVAHNHPAGNPAPSEADKKLTAQLEAGARAVNVIFLDHLVIGTGSYYSFRDKKTKRR